MKKYDRLIILFILLATFLSVICYVLLKKSITNQGLLTATISQHGKVIKTICLNEVTKPYELVFEDGHGGLNKIEVSRGSIRISESNCPDQICVKHGPIHANESPAVCLPHELIIEVTSTHKMDAQTSDSLTPDAVSQ